MRREAVAQFFEINAFVKEVETDEYCSELKDLFEATDSYSDMSISLNRARLRAFPTVYQIER